MNGPPIKRKPPDKAGGGRKSSGSFGGQSQEKNTEDSRQFQGFGNRRHAGQNPPKWGKPGGQAALDRLALLWGKPRRPFPRRQQ